MGKFEVLNFLALPQVSRIGHSGFYMRTVDNLSWTPLFLSMKLQAARPAFFSRIELLFFSRPFGHLLGVILTFASRIKIVHAVDSELLITDLKKKFYDFSC